MALAVLTPAQISEKLLQKNYPAQGTYLAMFSTWWGGIVKDPGLMSVPIDDHLVHRGDGVFEAMKLISGKIFLLDEHLARLESSAGEIHIQLPYSLSEMKEIILETTRSASVENAILRLYISRGPGGFTTNPYESVGAQMYFVVTSLKPVAEEKYQSGVSIGRSQIPVKESVYAVIKTCNYLPNVLMKKESVDRKLDFTIGIDQTGFIAESSTENIVILDKNNNLCRPFLRQILKGTTMMRTFELAESLVKTGELASVQERDLTEKDLLDAKEVFMIGTTLDVLPVTTYENQKIGNGVQGPIGKKLLSMLREDMKSGPKATAI